MSQQARMARLLKGSLADQRDGWRNPPTPEYTPTFTLDRHVEQARADMGETRWQQLQAEWDAPRLSAIQEGGRHE